MVNWTDQDKKKKGGWKNRKDWWWHNFNNWKNSIFVFLVKFQWGSFFPFDSKRTQRKKNESENNIFVIQHVW